MIEAWKLINYERMRQYFFQHDIYKTINFVNYLAYKLIQSYFDEEISNPIHQLRKTILWQIGRYLRLLYNHYVENKNGVFCDSCHREIRPRQGRYGYYYSFNIHHYYYDIHNYFGIESTQILHPHCHRKIHYNIEEPKKT